jgi:SAM-dependent methyltransferase
MQPQPSSLCRRLLLPFVAAALAVAAGCADREAAPAGSEERPIVDVPPLMAVVPADAAAGVRNDSTKPPRRGADVVYVPTPQPVVDAMLELAEVQPGDVLYDLGSGDGRIPITAARRHGVRAIGIDIDPDMVREANANARQAGVAGLVSFREDDLFEADFGDADVVTLYLLDSLNLKLRPRLLAELEPGTRIVSHAFGMGDWTPERTLRVGNSTLYRWTVPERPQRQKE